MDISDGLLQDLGHLCRASQVGAELALEALPTSPEFLAACHELGTSAEACTLRGGEDYELLFTSSPEHREAWLAESSSTPLRRIGQLVHAPGITLVEPNGTRRNPSREDKGPAGFRHF